MSVKISGEKYAMMYGPTVGDKVRLADTSLVVEVEKDFTTYGEDKRADHDQEITFLKSMITS